MNIATRPLVLDLSHYQNVTSFAKVKAAGVRGIINKATEGAKITDKTFAVRRQPVKDAGLLYGAYHFLRPGPIAVQVEHFLSVVGSTDGMLLALDHEDTRVSLAAAKQFLELVRQRVGRYPILYSGFLIKEQLGGQADPDLAKVRLWLSHYSSTPTWHKTWKTPWLWQFTDGTHGPLPHTIPGIGGGVDINAYYDGANLAGEWASEARPDVPQPLPAPVPPIPPAVVTPRKPPLSADDSLATNMPIGPPSTSKKGATIGVVVVAAVVGVGGFWHQITAWVGHLFGQ